MTRLVITDAHLLDVEAGELTDRSWVDIADGWIAEVGTGSLDELRIRAQVQRPADVIRSATTTAADLLGKSGELGIVAAGARADLLVVAGDPLADISVLTAPARHLNYVIKGGDFVATPATTKE